jgi:hypothetical protein
MVSPPSGFRASPSCHDTVVPSLSSIRFVLPLEILIIAANPVYTVFAEHADDGSRWVPCHRASSSTSIRSAPPSLTAPTPNPATRHIPDCHPRPDPPSASTDTASKVMVAIATVMVATATTSRSWSPRSRDQPNRRSPPPP